MIWLADAVLVVHALIALFIVGGLAAIWVGSGLGWEWVHSWLFRLAHLFAIGLVSTLSLLGLACPLTVLEDWLRIGSVGGRSEVGRGSVGSVEAQGFIQRWVSRLLYYDVDLGFHSRISGVCSDGATDLAPGATPTTRVTQRRFAARSTTLQPSRRRSRLPRCGAQQPCCRRTQRVDLPDCRADIDRWKKHEEKRYEKHHARLPSNQAHAWMWLTTPSIASRPRHPVPPAVLRLRPLPNLPSGLLFIRHAYSTAHRDGTPRQHTATTHR